MFRICFGKTAFKKEDSPKGRRHDLVCQGVTQDEPICQPSVPRRDTDVYQRLSNTTAENRRDGQDIVDAEPGTIATSAMTRDAPSGRKTRLNASRLQEMDAENVVMCDAARIMDGLGLRRHELGRGTYGIVVPGTYRGVKCAVKVMLSAGLDSTALRELLLAPRLVHPNIVSTFATRVAHLTHAFFDLLEGASIQEHDTRSPRTLEPAPFHSGDGFGDPAGLDDDIEPLRVLHEILHALGADAGKVVVVVIQEYCDCGTLDRAIRRKIFEPNPPNWGLRLARRTLLRTAGEIAKGLIHLHDAGVVHGDLKPANVLLIKSEEDRRGYSAKLADFGMSHLLPDAATSLITESSWGSIAYMAPEAFNGKVSRATDVWAFGVILWQMLTGERPYLGMEQNEVIQGLKRGTLALIWPENAAMAAPIIGLGRRCLDINREQRPTIEVVAEHLVNIERAIRAELLLGPQSRTDIEGHALHDTSGGITGLVLI